MEKEIKQGSLVYAFGDPKNSDTLVAVFNSYNIYKGDKEPDNPSCIYYGEAFAENCPSALKESSINEVFIMCHRFGIDISGEFHKKGFVKGDYIIIEDNNVCGIFDHYIDNENAAMQVIIGSNNFCYFDETIPTECLECANDSVKSLMNDIMLKQNSVVFDKTNHNIKPWLPSENDKYYYVDDNFKINCANYADVEPHKLRSYYGNVFYNKETASKYLESMKKFRMTNFNV